MSYIQIMFFYLMRILFNQFVSNTVQWFWKPDENRSERVNFSRGKQIADLALSKLKTEQSANGNRFIKIQNINKKLSVCLDKRKRISHLQRDTGLCDGAVWQNHVSSPGRYGLYICSYYCRTAWDSAQLHCHSSQGFDNSTVCLKAVVHSSEDTFDNPWSKWPKVHLKCYSF